MLLMRNAMIATEQGVHAGDIAIEYGKIAAILEPGATVAAEQVIDCAGKLVFPGGVDVHVHANDPGNTEREDFHTITRAAAAGGITTIVDMPVDTVPPPLDSKSYAGKLAVAEANCCIDFALWGGMVDDNLAALPGLFQAGAAGFKAFMTDAGPEYPRIGGEALRQGFVAAGRLGEPVLVHAEDYRQCSEGETRCRRLGKNRPEDFLAVHSRTVENKAVGEALTLANGTGCHIHICHASNPGAVELVAQAKRGGLSASVETCMHYLVFCDNDFVAQPGLLKCAPPLRSPADREGLWHRLLAGDIDMVGSDHSPSRPDECDPGQSIWDIWAGINSVQATLQLLYSEGVVKRGLSLPHFVKMVSSNPARLAGLFPIKGDVRVGGDADLVVLDPNAEWTWTRKNWLTKHDNTPYLRCSGTGAVIATLVRGNVVYTDGAAVAEPGFGKYCARRVESP
ncbi:MAG: allantoinase AllB [Planctomycetes bacterium]|nr:allantoinase AllB [Planctomycetota bacterium]